MAVGPLRSLAGIARARLRFELPTSSLASGQGWTQGHSCSPDIRRAAHRLLAVSRRPRVACCARARLSPLHVHSQFRLEASALVLVGLAARSRPASIYLPAMTHGNRPLLCRNAQRAPDRTSSQPRSRSRSPQRSPPSPMRRTSSRIRGSGAWRNFARAQQRPSADDAWATALPCAAKDPNGGTALKTRSTSRAGRPVTSVAEIVPWRRRARPTRPPAFGCRGPVTHQRPPSEPRHQRHQRPPS